MFRWLAALAILIISFSSANLQAGTGTCASSDGWQFLASDPFNQTEIRFKQTSGNNVLWALVNNSNATITDVGIGRKRYEYPDGFINHGSAEYLGGTTAPTNCETNTVADQTSGDVDRHGDIVRLGMWVCKVTWKNSTSDDIIRWAGNGCTGSADETLVTSGSSGGGDGGGGTTPPADPDGGIISALGSQSFNITGEVGGPFESSNGYLDITNSGDQPLFFSVNNNSTLIDVHPSAGYLAPGQSSRLSVSLTSEVNQLYERTYFPGFSVRNTSNGQGSANWIGTLNVLPSTKFVVTDGYFESYRVISQGSAFNPQSRDYSVKNNTQETIQYTVTADKNWLSFSPASGNLAPGETITVSAILNQNAQALTARSPSSLIYFNDNTHNITVRRQTILSIFDQTSQLEVVPDTAIEITQIVGGLRGNIAKKFQVKNPIGGGTIYYRVSFDADWMGVAINSRQIQGTETTELLLTGTSETINVYPKLNDLALGTYQGTITIEDVANPTVSYTLPVTMVKRDVNAGSIQVTPVAPISINLEADAGVQDTHLKVFEIKNFGETIFDYTVTSDQFWARAFRLSDADQSASNPLASTAPSECPCEIAASGTLFPGQIATVYVRSQINSTRIANGADLANISFTNTTNGEGNVSVPIQVNTVANSLPSVPVDFQVTRFTDKNIIRWDLDFTHVENYEIEHSTDGVNFTASTAPYVVPFWDTFYKARNNRRILYFSHPGSYYYRIRACNTLGCGDYTNSLRAPDSNKNLSTGTQYFTDKNAESTTIIATKNQYSDRIRVSWQHTQDPSVPRYNTTKSYDYFLLYRSEHPLGAKTPLPTENTYIRQHSLAVEPERSNYLYYWDTGVVPGKAYYYWVKQCYQRDSIITFDCDPDFSFYSTGYTNRSAGQLSSTKGTSFNVSMNEGSPNGLPAPMNLEVENSGMQTMSWSLSTDQPWLQLSKSSGGLIGGQQDTINLSVNSQSTSFAPGIYSANLSLINTSNGTGNENLVVTLTVNASPIPESSPSLSASDGFYSDRVSVDWEAVSGATYYTLNRTLAGVTEQSYSVNTTSFNDNAATVDTNYVYSLLACNSSGCSLPITDAGSRTLDDNDLDGVNNAFDPDDDNDNVVDEWDSFPFDSTESLDSDRDGIGNNADPDDDNDGVEDALDMFPFDKEESKDSDLDGIGDNEDLDDNGDGFPDAYEVLKRSEIAKSVIEAKYGIDYIPPAATGTIFDDVNTGDFNAAWIEKLAADGLTEGCAIKRYCPDMVVTTEQMPKIMLKTLFGSAYIPTAATGSLFSDVSSSSFAANWIEELSNQSLTEGCDVNNFCPKQTVTSEGFLQMMKQAYP